MARSQHHSTCLALPGALALTVILIACTTVPDIGRSSFNFIPNSHLSEMGLTEFEKMKTQKRLSGNSTQIAMVERVAGRTQSDQVCCGIATSARHFDKMMEVDR